MRLLLLFCLLATSFAIAQDDIPTFGERADESEGSADPTAAVASPGAAYTDYRWKPVAVQAFAAPPVLESNEKITDSTGVAYAWNRAVWVAEISDGAKVQMRLVSWNPSSGETLRSGVFPEKIRGLAWDKESGMLLVRLRAHMLWLDAQLTETKRMPFAKLSQEWRDQLVVGGELYVSTGGQTSLDIFDKNDLSPKGSLPLGNLKPQRVFALEPGKLLLWSSYWGSKLKVFDIAQQAETEILHAAFSYKSFRKAAVMENNRLGIFDLASPENMGVAVRHASSLVNLFHGAESGANGLAIRFGPIRQTIRAVLQISPKNDIPSSTVVVNIPYADTYSQRIHTESTAGTITTDSYGNRYALVQLPAMPKGVAQTIDLYSADITRYQVSFDILAARPQFAEHAEFAIHLADNPIFDLAHPLVAETQQRVMSGTANYLQQIVAAHAFSMSVKPLWDGKNEPVPAVIRNMHGGCNEHTRVIVALLRLSKIPARYAWNHLWRGPAEKEFTKDHAIAEAWVEGLGWVPLEGLGRRPGYITPYFLFNVGYPESNKAIPRPQGPALNLKNQKATVKWRID